VCGLPDEPGTAYRILRAVSEANIEVDMIVLNAPRDGKSDLSFTVHRDEYVQARRLADAARSLFPGTSLASSDRVAKLSVVGVGMRSHAGVATKLFKTLAENGVNVRMVSTSEIKISVLIQESDLERGVKALHECYSLASP
jgi:aspartate kinase